MLYARKAIISLFLVSMIFCSWLALLDPPASMVVDAGLKNALISFATARALNAVISVAQGTEVAIEPMGVGVNLAPGQLLYPINELVEQFSSLMLAACVAFGIQKFLINIGAYWPVSLILTMVALGWAWFYFRQRQAPGWLSRVLVILLMVRFAIPMVSIGTDLMFQKFLAAEYQKSQQAIGNAPNQITELNPPDQSPDTTSKQPDDTALGQGSTPDSHLQTPTEDHGWMGKVPKWLHELPKTTKSKLEQVTKTSKEKMDVKTHFKNLQQKAEQWIEYIIKIIVIFLLQTLIIPLLLIWALYSTARGTFELPRPITTANGKL